MHLRLKQFGGQKKYELCVMWKGSSRSTGLEKDVLEALKDLEDAMDGVLESWRVEKVNTEAFEKYDVV